MIHLALFLPLVIIGTTGAVWREYKQNKNHQEKKLQLTLKSDQEFLRLEDQTKEQTQTFINPFDDIGELTHYQRVAWYSLAFSTAGVWFYPPAVLLALPLLGYNSYHFIRVIKNSEKNSRTSPLTVFETIGIGGTLLTGHAALGSAVLVGSFSMRNLFLQGNNLSKIASNHVIRMKYASMWVLRDNIEIEILLSELQSDDIFVLHAGDIALIEGRIIKGTGIIYQYSLQKTMKYIHKEQGDIIFPFTQLQEGYLHVQRK
jgi:cation transport ATPase